MMDDPKLLLAHYLGGDLSEEQAAQLIQALRDDSTFRAAARDSVTMHGLLTEREGSDDDCRQLLQRVERAIVLENPPREFEEKLIAQLENRRNRRVFIRLAVAAALVLAGLGIWFAAGLKPEVAGATAARRITPPQPIAVAVLTAKEDAVWGPGENRFEVGHPLVSGYYQLKQGIVALQTSAGNLLVARAPAEFELRSGEQMRLQAGSIGVHIRKGGAFRVRTPGLRIVDLGTEFGVNVDEAGRTKLYVFDGAVGVFREGGDIASGMNDGMRVVAGTGLGFEPNGGQYESIGGAGEGFLQASRVRSAMGIGDYERLVLAQGPMRFWRFDDVVNGMAACSAGGDPVTLNHGAGVSLVGTNRVLQLPAHRDSAGWKGIRADGGPIEGAAVTPPFSISFWYQANGEQLSGGGNCY